MLAVNVVTALLMALTLVGRLAPQSPLGRDIVTFVVRPLARRVVRIHRGHLLVATSLLLVAALLVHVLGGDAPVLIAFGGPDLVGMLTALDAATLVDALVGVLLVTAGARSAPVRAMLGSRMSGRAGNVRVRRNRVVNRRTVRPDNDDFDDRRPALAA